MTEIGEKFWRGSRAAAPRVRGLVRGISLPSGGKVWVGGCALPRKCLRFLPENGAFWLHFLPDARFFLQFKGGAWPKWPNGKYATG